MAYTVLARKYRSRTFDEVIGQEPIATTLVNAIKVGRIHHGYLFTGTRGVGKTSMARILAKALNCTKYDAPSTTPCCECDVCRAIAEGQDVDVLEIDAASNTGVDNIRELRSNTAYRPARSRFKVYIIDEVHMLSTGAFNALLKTLEEPPEHVKFILATTEIHKVPATIQSRCQRFNFRTISPDAIAKRLTEIAAAEGATAADAVVQRVARLANGSMRDALSILDQLLSVSPKKLTAKVLDEILPPAQDERIFVLLRHAADGDATAVLKDFDGILGAGQGLEVFCNDAIGMVRTLMLVRTCGPDAAIVDIPAAARDEYVQLSQQFELSHYVQMIGMLEELRRNVRYSGVGRPLTEAVLVRFARLREWTPIEQLLRQLPATTAAAAVEKKKPAPVSAPSEVGGDKPVPLPRREGVGGGFGSVAQDSHPALPLGGGGASSGHNPSDAETPAPTEPRGAEIIRREVSAEELRQVEQDPIIRQTLELFGGILIHVEHQAPAVAPAATEPRSLKAAAQE
jgi:DNA polymerase-3 subunit gamma/tau